MSRPSCGKRAMRKKNTKENPYPRAPPPVSAKRPSAELSPLARTVTRSNSPKSPSNAPCLPQRKEKRNHANLERTRSERRGVPLPAREENVLRRRRRPAEQHGHHLSAGKSCDDAYRSLLVRANAVPDRTRWRFCQHGEMPAGTFVLRNRVAICIRILACQNQ